MVTVLWFSFVMLRLKVMSPFFAGSRLVTYSCSMAAPFDFDGLARKRNELCGRSSDTLRSSVLLL